MSATPDVMIQGDDGQEANRRGRKRPAARRAEIIDAARAVFALAGYEDAGLADISEEARVSKGLLYHYFPEGRPALFAAVSEQILIEVADRAASRAPAPLFGA